MWRVCRVCVECVNSSMLQNGDNFYVVILTSLPQPLPKSALPREQGKESSCKKHLWLLISSRGKLKVSFISLSIQRSSTLRFIPGMVGDNNLLQSGSSGNFHCSQEWEKARISWFTNLSVHGSVTYNAWFDGGGGYLNEIIVCISQKRADVTTEECCMVSWKFVQNHRRNIFIKLHRRWLGT